MSLLNLKPKNFSLGFTLALGSSGGKFLSPDFMSKMATIVALEVSKACLRNEESSSLFFSTKLSVKYSTSLAVCFTVKDNSLANLGKEITVELACWLLMSAWSLSSVLLREQAPSTKLKIPGGNLAYSSALTIGLLSV